MHNNALHFKVQNLMVAIQSAELYKIQNFTVVLQSTDLYNNSTK